MRVLNTISIVSGYAGHDPQGETSNERLLQVLFSSQKMVKVILLVLEKKRKISYVNLWRKWEIEKVEKIGNNFIQEN